MRGTAEFLIIGRIGRIAEVGQALKINIASDYPRRNDRGEWENNTHWNTVTLFGDERVARVKDKYKAGDMVQARGRMRNVSYEKNGDTIYTVDLIATEFVMLAKADAKPQPGEDDQIPF